MFPVWNFSSSSFKVTCHTFFTLPSHNQTCHAVWNAGPCCQEGNPHDVVWDVECVADNGDLKQEETSGSSFRLCGYMCDTHL